jgi:hypothetical protein
VRLSPLDTAASTGLLYQSRDYGDCLAIGGIKDWHWKPKYSEKTCPGATLPTTIPTCPDPGSNSGRRGGNPATNGLS